MSNEDSNILIAYDSTLFDYCWYCFI